MAELSKVRRPSRAAVLKRVQEQPMPPARLPLQPQPEHADLPKFDIGNQLSGAGEGREDPGAQSETVVRSQIEPNLMAEVSAASPSSSDADLTVRGVGEVQGQPVAEPKRAVASTVRLRFSLQFEDPRLREDAEEIAKTYGVPLTHIIAAVARKTKVSADDYRLADYDTGSTLRPGGTVRTEMVLDGAEVEKWIAKHDPLHVLPPSVVLRPVAVRAFERTAPSALAELKKLK